MGTRRTLIKIAFVEVVWTGNVHVIETCNLHTHKCSAWRPRTEGGGEERRGAIYGDGAVLHCGVLPVVSMVHASRSSRLASEVLQQLDLAQCALGQDLLAEDVGDLFDGHALARLVVGSRTVHMHQHPVCSLPLLGVLPDNAIGALSQLLCHIVALVDYEFLVEDLEHLAVREIRHGWRRGGVAGDDKVRAVVGGREGERGGRGDGWLSSRVRGRKARRQRAAAWVL